MQDHLCKTSEAVSYDTLTEGQKTMGLELAGVGLMSVDYVAGTVTPDARTADVFGLVPYVPVSREQFHARIHPSDRNIVLGLVDRLLDPDFDDVIDVTHRTVDARGKVRWVRARKCLYRDEYDPLRRPITGVAAVLDLTAEKEAQERTDFLMREMRHRTSNIFSVVSSIARMVMRTGDAANFLDRFLPRLQSLSASMNLDRADGVFDLKKTIETVVAPFTASGGQISVAGPSVDLESGAAQAYGMIAHELATNAVKYGAWSGITGRVEVSWFETDTGELVWTWREFGGPAVAEPLRQGFGSQVLQSFASQSLSGEVSVTYAPDGLIYRLTTPPPR